MFIISEQMISNDDSQLINFMKSTFTRQWTTLINIPEIISELLQFTESEILDCQGNELNRLLFDYLMEGCVDLNATEWLAKVDMSKFDAFTKKRYA